MVNSGSPWVEQSGLTVYSDCSIHPSLMFSSSDIAANSFLGHACVLSFVTVHLSWCELPCCAENIIVGWDKSPLRILGDQDYLALS